MAKREKKKRAEVSAESFIRAWQNAADLNGLVKAVGLSESAAKSRVASYRKRGVPLKKFPRRGGGGLALDWDKLAKLAADLVKK